MAALPKVVAATLALVAATDVFLLYGAHAADPVTPDEAVARYRAAPGGDATGGPPPGVYLYDTAGFAAVDALGVRRDYPAVSTRIVRARPGCGWREEVALFAEHVETYDTCAGRPAGFGTRLVYFAVPSETDLACAADGTCHDPDNDVSATLTTHRGGHGAAVVGGRTVRCVNVSLRTVLRGSTAGGAVRDLCVEPATGLVLTERRSVGLVARSRFVGRVTYTEHATFTLRSLEPLR